MAAGETGIAVQRVRAMEATMRPMQKIAPRCVLIPPVARSICRSASTPSGARLPSNEPACLPAAARHAKGRSSESADRRMRSKSMSSWAPESTGLTRPGLG
jgi:hypothetical protein